MAALTSHVLYGRRQSPHFVEPIVAGLEKVAMLREPSDDATQVEKNRTESGGRRFRAAFKEGLLAPVPLTERRALGGTGGRTGRALTFTSSLRYLGSEGIGQGTMVRMY